MKNNTLKACCTTEDLTYDDDDKLLSVKVSCVVTRSYGYNGRGMRLKAVENGANRYDIRDGTDVTADVLNDNQANYTPGISEYRNNVRTFYTPGVKSVGAQTGTSGATNAVAFLLECACDPGSGGSALPSEQALLRRF